MKYFSSTSRGVTQTKMSGILNSFIDDALMAVKSKIKNREFLPTTTTEIRDAVLQWVTQHIFEISYQAMFSIELRQYKTSILKSDYATMTDALTKKYIRLLENRTTCEKRIRDIEAELKKIEPSHLEHDKNKLTCPFVFEIYEKQKDREKKGRLLIPADPAYQDLDLFCQEIDEISKRQLLNEAIKHAQSRSTAQCATALFKIYCEMFNQLIRFAPKQYMLLSLRAECQKLKDHSALNETQISEVMAMGKALSDDRVTLLKPGAESCQSALRDLQLETDGLFKALQCASIDVSLIALPIPEPLTVSALSVFATRSSPPPSLKSVDSAGSQGFSRNDLESLSFSPT